MRKLLLWIPFLFIGAFAQAQHQVALTWKAPSTTYTVNYNIYRCIGTCTVSSSTWTKIASATATTYTDSTVTAGTTYNYYVTAFDPTGTNSESVPSNMYTGTIPSGGGTSGGQTPPATGLTGSVS